MPLPFQVSSVSEAILRQEWAQTNQTLQGVHDLLCSIDAHLDEIARLQRRKDPMRTSIVLPGTAGNPPVAMPYTIAMMGYRHARLWLGANASISVDFGLGTGPATIAMVAGWNVLDAPEGAILAATTGAAVNAVLELTDDRVQ